MRISRLATGGVLWGLPLAAAAQDTGAYLTRAADCVACHTAPGGAPFAGGRAFTTPFGVIYSPNITPDRQTGIGAYTDTDFLAALQRGIGRGGRHLYPAMPYTSYTLISDRDALAMKAYLFTLPAIVSPARPAALHFPYNQRWGLALWNAVNNPDHRFAADPSHSPAWNRGAYLTEALGHCSQCHSPRNWMQGVKAGAAAYGGALQQGWLAYNISSDPVHGIGGWSDEAVAQYLSTGQAPGHGAASGPMAEVVTNSLRFLTAGDISAMVTYLRSIKPVATGPANAAGAAPEPGLGPDALGARVFAQACSGCHLTDGRGRQSPWGALAGAHTATDPGATNLIAVLVQGSTLQTSTGTVFMHGYAGSFTDPELAGVARYVSARFGATTAAVTPADIRTARTAPP